MPPPGYNDMFALFKQRQAHASKATCIRSWRTCFTSRTCSRHRARRDAGESSDSDRRHAAASPRFEPIIGRYLNLDLLGRPHRLYFEEAGHGIPLLCLHTAGSDGRQYRGLLNEPRITDHFRVIVFDMPWHGKSSPPDG